MEDDDMIVGRKSKVAFDSRTAFERGGEGDQAVFRKCSTVVQAAVRETCRSGI